MRRETRGGRGERGEGDKGIEGEGEGSRWGWGGIKVGMGRDQGGDGEETRGTRGEGGESVRGIRCRHINLKLHTQHTQKLGCSHTTNHSHPHMDQYTPCMCYTINAGKGLSSRQRRQEGM